MPEHRYRYWERSRSAVGSPAGIDKDNPTRVKRRFRPHIPPAQRQRKRRRTQPEEQIEESQPPKSTPGPQKAITESQKSKNTSDLPAAIVTTQVKGSVSRCRACQVVGHTVRECVTVRQRGLCFKCLRSGHSSKECTGDTETTHTAASLTTGSTADCNNHLDNNYVTNNESEHTIDLLEEPPPLERVDSDESEEEARTRSVDAVDNIVPH
ncbi:MAG: hypothetical protein MHM6MM_004117 [Cercozoa sp. M6MM]